MAEHQGRRLRAAAHGGKMLVLEIVAGDVSRGAAGDAGVSDWQIASMLLALHNIANALGWIVILSMVRIVLNK